LDEVERIVAQIRRHWPHTRIILRADSGFCREDLMAWCETHDVDYVFGLAKNSRLLKRLKKKMKQAAALFAKTAQAARVFDDFAYQTLTSWSRERRVVAKAEHLDKGPNPRFVVTSLEANDWSAEKLYEDLYCGRGDMENRIKEQQLDLFADRTSAETMRANQLRLYFSAFAYVLLTALRRSALEGTSLQDATCATLRLRLLKIGAQIKVSVRRVWVRLSSAYPLMALFKTLWEKLRASPPPLRL
jgi:hypothetical protein